MIRTISALRSIARGPGPGPGAAAAVRRPASRALALLVLVLAATPASAAALDRWGPLGMIDGRDGSLQQFLGVAVAPDGSAIYAVEQRARTTDDCGNTYTPVVVHRYVLSPDRSSATETGQVTLAGDSPTPSYPYSDFPIAVATGTGGRRLLLLGLTSKYDVNGDGVCTPVTDPAVLTELDATTLAPVRSLDRAALGGLDVERLAAAGDGSARVWALGSPSGGSPSLMRFDGVPGEVAPANAFPLYRGVLPPPTGRCFAPPRGAGYTWIAAESSGTVLLQIASGQWRSCTNLGTLLGEVLRVGADGIAQQPAVATFAPDPSGIPFPPNYFLYSVTTPLAVDPASGDLFLGQYANVAPGLQQRHGDGTLVRAFGPQGPPVHLGDTTQPACAFSYQQDFWLAAAPGLVVAASPQPFDPTAPPGTTGPIISWFGVRDPAPRCLLTPKPTANLSVTPATGATVGSELTLDASASSPDQSRAIDADNSLTYRFESDGSGYGPPTTNPVYHVPITQPGTYSLGVLVTDRYGQEAEMRHDYYVPAPAPVAVLSVSDPRPRVGEAVTFDASGSTGSPIHYELDLDGSGAYATDLLSTSVTTYRFTQPGLVQVSLRVTNTAGAQASTKVAVDVQAAPGSPPPAPPDIGLLAATPGGLLAFPSVWTTTSAPSVRLRLAGPPDGGGRLTVQLDCRVGGADCAGVVWLSTRGGQRSSTAAPFRLREGGSARVRLLLDRRVRAAVRRSAFRGTLLARLIAPNGAIVRDPERVLVRGPRRTVGTQGSGR